MEQSGSPNGASFWQNSARVEQWRQSFHRPVCAGAGARGWCDIMLHCSISSIGESGEGNIYMNILGNLPISRVERFAPFGGFDADVWSKGVQHG